MTVAAGARRVAAGSAFSGAAPGAPRGALGLPLHRAVDHRLPGVHAHADDRDARSSRSPNINLAQEEPLAVRRPATTTQTLLGDQQAWDVARRHVPVRRCWPCRSRSSCRSSSPSLLNSTPPARLGRSSGSCSSCRTSSRSSPACSSGRACSTSRRAGSTAFLRLIGIAEPAQLAAATRRWIYPGLVIIGHLGDRRRDDRQPRRPARASRPSCYDAARIDGAGLRGRSSAT